MPQVTLYLDEETRHQVAEAARAESISQSRWVAQAIRDRIQLSWPRGWDSVLGSFPDFPMREEPPRTPDAERIGF